MNLTYTVRTSDGDLKFGLGNDETKHFSNSLVHVADLSVLLPNGEILNIPKTEININPTYPIICYKNDVDDRLHRIVNGGFYYDFDFRELLVVCVDQIFHEYTVDMIDNYLKYLNYRIRIFKNDKLIVDRIHNGSVLTKILEYGFIVDLNHFPTSSGIFIDSRNPEKVTEYSLNELFGDNGYFTTINDLLYKNKTIEDKYINFYFTLENDKNSKLIIDFSYKMKLQVYRIENEFIYDHTRNVLVKVPKKDTKSIFFLYYVKVKSNLKGVSVFGRGLSELYSDYRFDYIDHNKDQIRKLIADKYGVSVFQSREIVAEKYGSENVFKRYECEKRGVNGGNVSDGYSPWNSIYFLMLTNRYGYKDNDSFHSSIRYKHLVKYYHAEKEQLQMDFKNSYNAEKELYRLIKLVYPNAIYQFKDHWLAAQSIDIYIPEMKLGFEYQGK